MGTPSFALEALKSLINHNYNVVSVYTKAPKPNGRGGVISKTEVHKFAEELNIPVFTPKSLKKKEAIEEFLEQKIDICIVASYGLILPKAIIEAPKFGCINIHGSLLPKWRGASPIQMAIKHGDTITGITTMKMSEGLDDGDMLLKEEIPITPETTFLSLYNKMTKVGAKIIIPTINGVINGSIEPIKQDEQHVSYAPIIKKEDGLIDFNKDAIEIDRMIRAFNPFPSTYFYNNNYQLKILKSKPIIENHNYKIGEIISLKPLLIACKQNILEIQIIQREGKKPLPSSEFVKGYQF